MKFTNRIEAGKKLAQKLLEYKDEGTVVLGIPHGGVPVGFEIAKILNKPLDVIVTRKIGHPNQPELAIGAVTERHLVVLDSRIIHRFSDKWLEQAVEKAYKETQHRRQLFSDNPRISTSGRNVIVVDDGLATGFTMMAAIKELQFEQPDQIVAGAPVMSKEAYRLVSEDADITVTLLLPNTFKSVGHYYHDFPHISDIEAMSLIHES